MIARMAEAESIGIQVFCNGQVVATGNWIPGGSPDLVGGGHHEDINRVFDELNKEYDPVLLAVGEIVLSGGHEIAMPSGQYRVVFNPGAHF
jgi:hypothetical protein